MAWPVGEQLPKELQELFDGKNLDEKIGRAFLLSVVDQEGFPHYAMVSYGEALAMDARTLRLALWEGSTTTRQMRATGKASLCVAESSGVFYLKGTVGDLGAIPGMEPPLAKLEFRVRQALQDGDPNGEVISGIVYRSTEPRERTLARWQRQLAALREG